MTSPDIAAITDHEALLEAWQQDRYPGDEGFAKDGIVKRSAWKDAKPKILFVLKDPSTREFMKPENGGDLRRWTQNPASTYGSTWMNLARWATALLVPPEGELDLRGELARPTADGLLAKVAVVNLKKSAYNPSAKENTKADRLMVNAYAQRDRDFLLRQFDLIDPDVIVGCGVHQPMIWLLGLTPTEVSRIPTEKEASEQVRLVRVGGEGPMVFLTRHPGRAPVRPKGGLSVAEELRNLVGQAKGEGERR